MFGLLRRVTFDGNIDCANLECFYEADRDYFVKYYRFLLQQIKLSVYLLVW